MKNASKFSGNDFLTRRGIIQKYKYQKIFLKDEIKFKKKRKHIKYGMGFAAR